MPPAMGSSHFLPSSGQPAACTPAAHHVFHNSAPAQGTTPLRNVQPWTCAGQLGTVGTLHLRAVMLSEVTKDEAKKRCPTRENRKP